MAADSDMRERYSSCTIAKCSQDINSLQKRIDKSTNPEEIAALEAEKAELEEIKNEKKEAKAAEKAQKEAEKAEKQEQQQQQQQQQQSRGGGCGGNGKSSSTDSDSSGDNNSDSSTSEDSASEESSGGCCGGCYPPTTPSIPLLIKEIQALIKVTPHSDCSLHKGGCAGGPHEEAADLKASETEAEEAEEEAEESKKGCCGGRKKSQESKEESEQAQEESSKSSSGSCGGGRSSAQNAADSCNKCAGDLKNACDGLGDGVTSEALQCAMNSLSGTCSGLSRFADEIIVTKASVRSVQTQFFEEMNEDISLISDIASDPKVAVDTFLGGRLDSMASTNTAMLAKTDYMIGLFGSTLLSAKKKMTFGDSPFDFKANLLALQGVQQQASNKISGAITNLKDATFDMTDTLDQITNTQNDIKNRVKTLTDNVGSVPEGIRGEITTTLNEMNDIQNGIVTSSNKMVNAYANPPIDTAIFLADNYPDAFKQLEDATKTIDAASDHLTNLENRTMDSVGNILGGMTSVANDLVSDLSGATEKRKTIDSMLSKATADMIDGMVQDATSVAKNVSSYVIPNITTYSSQEKLNQMLASTSDHAFIAPVQGFVDSTANLAYSNMQELGAMAGNLEVLPNVSASQLLSYDGLNNPIDSAFDITSRTGCLQVLYDKTCECVHFLDQASRIEAPYFEMISGPIFDTTTRMLDGIFDISVLSGTKLNMVASELGSLVSAVSPFSSNSLLSSMYSTPYMSPLVNVANMALSLPAYDNPALFNPLEELIPEVRLINGFRNSILNRDYISNPEVEVMGMIFDAQNTIVSCIGAQVGNMLSNVLGDTKDAVLEMLVPLVGESTVNAINDGISVIGGIAANTALRMSGLGTVLSTFPNTYSNYTNFISNCGNYVDILPTLNNNYYANINRDPTLLQSIFDDLNIFTNGLFAEPFMGSNALQDYINGMVGVYDNPMLMMDDVKYDSICDVANVLSCAINNCTFDLSSLTNELSYTLGIPNIVRSALDDNYTGIKNGLAYLTSRTDAIPATQRVAFSGLLQYTTAFAESYDGYVQGVSNWDNYNTLCSDFNTHFYQTIDGYVQYVDMPTVRRCFDYNKMKNVQLSWKDDTTGVVVPNMNNDATKRLLGSGKKLFDDKLVEIKEEIQKTSTPEIDAKRAAVIGLYNDELKPVDGELKTIKETVTEDKELSEEETKEIEKLLTKKIMGTSDGLVQTREQKLLSIPDNSTLKEVEQDFPTFESWDIVSSAVIKDDTKTKAALFTSLVANRDFFNGSRLMERIIGTGIFSPEYRISLFPILARFFADYGFSYYDINYFSYDNFVIDFEFCGVKVHKRVDFDLLSESDFVKSTFFEKILMDLSLYTLKYDVLEEGRKFFTKRAKNKSLTEFVKASIIDYIIYELVKRIYAGHDYWIADDLIINDISTRMNRIRTILPIIKDFPLLQDLRNNKDEETFKKFMINLQRVNMSFRHCGYTLLQILSPNVIYS